MNYHRFQKAAFPIAVVDSDGDTQINWGINQGTLLLGMMMQGILATESEASGYHENTYRDPTTGKETRLEEVFPLDEHGKPDRAQLKIPCKLLRTREQNIAQAAMRLVEAALEVLP